MIDFNTVFNSFASYFESIVDIYKSIPVSIGTVSTSLFVVSCISLVLGMIVQTFFGGDDDDS